MNKIDRRFLKNMGFYVTTSGTSTTPPNPASVGDRVLISNTPNASTIFKGHANEVAYYDGTEWSFYKTEINDLVIDLYWNIHVFNGTQWEYKRSLDDYWVEANYYIFDAGTGETLPENPTAGSKFLFLKSNDKNNATIYEASSNGEWIPIFKFESNNYHYQIVYKTTNDGVCLGTLRNKELEYNSQAISGTLFLEATTNRLYVCDGNNLLKVLQSNEPYGKTVEPVAMIVSIGNALPSADHIGQKFIHTSDKKIYTAIDVGATGWGTGIALSTLSGGNRYASLNEPGAIYVYDGTNIEYRQHLAHGELFFNEADGCEYVYVSGANPYYEKLTPQIETTRTVTETHTLTAAEVTAKKFSLSSTVASGEETNILCFVQGLAQAAGVAFSLSGNELSWNGKTLDGNLTAGDVFIVSYQKAITLTN